MYWPGGNVQQETIPAAYINSALPFDLRDNTNPSISPSTLSAVHTIDPVTGLLNWTLTWNTDVSSKWDLDKVVFDVPGSPDDYVASPQYGTATVAAQLVPGGGYTHTLTVNGVPCGPGMYYYTVYSRTAYEVGDSDTGSKFIKFCPSN